MHGPMFKMLLLILLSSIEVVNSTLKELETSYRGTTVFGRERKFNAYATIDWEEMRDTPTVKRRRMICM